MTRTSSETKSSAYTNSLFKVVASAGNGAEHTNGKSISRMLSPWILPCHRWTVWKRRSFASKDPYLRILIVSALSDQATAIEALELGAKGFLCKPFDDDELKSALEILFGSSVCGRKPTESSS